MLSAFQQLKHEGSARLSGAWSCKPQRRYATPEQSGSGGGPYVESFDWRWDGGFVGATPLAGLFVLTNGGSSRWVKSAPPAVEPRLNLSMSSWTDRGEPTFVTARFHGAWLPSTMVTIEREPPQAIEIGADAVPLATPYPLVELGDLELTIVLFPASALRVGRNRLWRLRDELAVQLPPELATIATRGRTGRFG